MRDLMSCGWTTFISDADEASCARRASGATRQTRRSASTADESLTIRFMIRTSDLLGNLLRVTHKGVAEFNRPRQVGFVCAAGAYWPAGLLESGIFAEASATVLKSDGVTLTKLSTT